MAKKRYSGNLNHFNKKSTSTHPSTTIYKSKKSISTINDNMALKRLVDVCIFGQYRLGGLNSESFYSVNLAAFEQVSEYTGEKSAYNAITLMEGDINSLSEGLKQDLVEAYSLSMLAEDERYRVRYRPITGIKVDKETGEVFLRFSPEILSMVQGKLPIESVKLNKQGVEVTDTVYPLTKGTYFQQDTRMLGVPASAYALYDLLAKLLWQKDFKLLYSEIRILLELDYEEDGEMKSKYYNYSDFKNHILLPCLAQMDKRLGIKLKYEEIRHNRKVVYMRFIVVAGEQVPEVEPDPLLQLTKHHVLGQTFADSSNNQPSTEVQV